MDIKSKNKMLLYRRKGKKRSVCKRPVVEAEEVLKNNSYSDSEMEANQPEYQPAKSPNIETPERDPGEPDTPAQIKIKRGTKLCCQMLLKTT